MTPESPVGAAVAEPHNLTEDLRPALVVRRRLWPLYLATLLANVALWVPIEKLFMTGIGFDNGSVAVMAAVYAAIIPLLEVPSGILADRWSRKGVATVALSALALSATIGGLSTNVGVYLLSALFLGVFFAMNSGTIDSMVYDAVVEQTGNGDLFERIVGRLRMMESAALVASGLAGGLLAELVPLRTTYFLTLPFIGGAILALLSFQEPRLHKAEVETPLRSQVSATYRTLLERGGVRPLVVLLVLTALLTQAMAEFGPLWMVDLDAAAGLYAPQWAGLMAALGLGGLLGSRLALNQPATAVAVAVGIVSCSLALTMSHDVAVVITTQILLMLLVVAVSIPVTARLHDAIPSTIRAGVSSGVGTLTWMAFLPFAFGFGAISDSRGVHAAGWALVVVAGLAVLALTWAIGGLVRSPVAVPLEPAFAADAFLPPDDPIWPGHWARPPTAWDPSAVQGPEILSELRAAIDELPSPQREVLMARDVEGDSPTQVQALLGLTAEQERDLLDQARSQLRDRLDSFIEERGEHGA